jgi:hypothetical protein
MRARTLHVVTDDRKRFKDDLESVLAAPRDATATPHLPPA